MELQIYAKLLAVIDGSLQTEQAAITIHDRVDKPCRVTIESCIPSKGPEFNARKRLGDRVDVAIFLMGAGHKVQGEPMLTMSAKVVEATTADTNVNDTARHTFVLEHCEPER